MRLALLGLAATLSALPLSAQTFSHVSQSSVTLAATYSRPGDFDQTEKKRSDGDYTVSFSFSTIRFGNSQLLDVLVESGLIPEKKGWAIVAVWADWESSGASSYRFFARKKIAGVYDTRRIPDEVLALELLEPYVTKTVKTDAESEEIISGSDRYKAYTRLTLGADPRESEDPEDPAERRITASTPLGMIAGSGRYALPSGADAVFYLPNSASFTGYGSSAADASEVSDVVVASLKLGKSSAVPSSQYEDDFTGENPSRGPDSTAVVLP
jgi:hypothetical protein